MPNGFSQMGGIPEGYDSLLNSARQQLVRMPDGTLQLAPQFGGSTNLNQIYGGILPPSIPSPRSPVGAGPGSYGTMVGFANDPIYQGSPGFAADTMTATRTEQSGSRPAITQGTQPAGMMPMPPGVRPASVDRAFAQIGIQPSGGTGRGQPTRTAQVADPFGTRVTGGYQDRLPSNDGGEAGFLSTFYPDATNPAVDAIDITVNGGKQMPPLPRMRPIPPAQIPLTSVMPKAAANPPQLPGPYVIKKGDTLGALAKRFGTTVNQLANANNIANPNKIRAGATLNLGFMAPPVPRMPPAALGRAPQQQSRPRETFDQIWAEAQG